MANLITVMPTQAPQYMVATMINQGKTPAEIQEQTGFSPTLISDYLATAYDPNPPLTYNKTYNDVPQTGAFAPPPGYTADSLSAHMADIAAGGQPTAVGNGGPGAADWTSAYQTYLGRAPDAGGQAWWQGQIDSGAITPAQAFDGIAHSAEAAQVASGNIVPPIMTPDQWVKPSGQAPVTTVGPTIYTPPPAQTDPGLKPVAPSNIYSPPPTQIDPTTPNVTGYKPPPTNVSVPPVATEQVDSPIINPSPFISGVTGYRPAPTPTDQPIYTPYSIGYHQPTSTDPIVAGISTGTSNRGPLTNIWNPAPTVQGGYNTPVLDSLYSNMQQNFGGSKPTFNFQSKPAFKTGGVVGALTRVIKHGI